MNLLEQKKELVYQMFLITKEVHDSLSDESFDEFDQLNVKMDRRNELMAKIDEIDAQMKQAGVSLDDDVEIKRSITINLSGIISMGESIAEATASRMDVAAADLKDVNEKKKSLDFNKEIPITGSHLDISQ